MALRTILIDGDSALRKRSRVVTDFNKRLWELLDDMKDTMMESNGFGLAAPQVGVLRRAFIVYNTKEDEEGEEDDDEILELINPEIIEASEEIQSGPEGCLSVPGVWGIVNRPMRVKMRAQDRYGNFFEVDGEGMTARGFCHEFGHLDGQLFIDVAEKILDKKEIQELFAQQEEEDGEKK